MNVIFLAFRPLFWDMILFFQASLELLTSCLCLHGTEIIGTALNFFFFYKGTADSERLVGITTINICDNYNLFCTCHPWVSSLAFDFLFAN